MLRLYPQTVDERKATIGGLPTDGRTAIDLGMESAPYAEIGARLRAIRAGLSDMSQTAWADRHGFNKTQYNNWEKGVRRIPVDEAERLCRTYGLTLDFIYMGRRDGLSDKASKAL